MTSQQESGERPEPEKRKAPSPDTDAPKDKSPTGTLRSDAASSKQRGGGNASDAKATATPPPGTDDRKHAATQRNYHLSDVIRTGYLPACMATAHNMNGAFDAPVFRTFLENFLRDAGAPQDPIEIVLIHQLAFSHLRLADLHAQAAEAKSLEAVKLYTAAEARLLAEVRRLAISIPDYRQRTNTGGKVRLAETG